MAAAGHQAEEALHKAMKEYDGKYLLVIDGSVPLVWMAPIPDRRQSTWRP